MLSTKSENTVTEGSAHELPQGAEQLELSLDDMLRADCLDATTLEEFLTSPLIQDDSPEETPFLDTPSEDIWTSPMVDEEDDSFGFSEMPLFGAAVRRKEDSSTAIAENGKITPKSFDLLDLLQYCTPPEPTAPSAFESSKMDAITTPALDTLDSTGMYTFPPTPALAPTSLYNSPRRPATHLAPSSTSSSSTAAASSLSTSLDAATTVTFDATSKHLRPTKPIPTGTRRNITPAALVPLDAPTQPRQYVTPSVTSRKVVPAAFTKGKKRARSEVDGHADDAEQQQVVSPDDLDPNTHEAIETKRRQNTLAARRSRQRKLEHVRELEDAVERVTRDRDMWMTRAYDAEAKLREYTRLS